MKKAHLLLPTILLIVLPSLAAARSTPESAQPSKAYKSGEQVAYDRHICSKTAMAIAPIKGFSEWMTGGSYGAFMRDCMQALKKIVQYKNMDVLTSLETQSEIAAKLLRENPELSVDDANKAARYLATKQDAVGASAALRSSR